MTQELWVLVWAAIWGLLQILIAAAAPFTQKGYMRWNASPRDSEFDVGPVAGRMRRAYQNYLETFPFFAALVLVVAFAGLSDDLTRWGVWLYLGARLLYFPAYALGARLRSACFAASVVGIVLIAFSLVRSAV